LQNEQVRIQGYAVVDNNTDEDWKNFRVCVVTGQPITFSTDLAESKTPSRNRVNLVPESAIGAIDIEEGFAGGSEDFMVMGAGAEEMAAEPMRVMAKRRVPGSADRIVKADMAEAETEEVGDFCFYQSADLVTVAAKRSAAIPVFDKDLAEAKSLLHYDYVNHPVSPYRSIQLVNSLPHSLGKGVCTVYQEGAFAGSCIIPEMKEGQVRLLAHALDSGVKVQKTPGKLSRTLVSLQIDGGVGIRKEFVSKTTTYKISNRHKEDFQLILDHYQDLSLSKGAAFLVQQDREQSVEPQCELKQGWRYELELSAKSDNILQVREHRTNTSRTELVRKKKDRWNFDSSWIQSNIIHTDGPLAADDSVKKCMGIQLELTEIEDQIAKTWNQSRKLEERQERLRKNIETAGTDAITNRWREDLGELEDKIREIEDFKIPELHSKKIEIEERFRNALLQLSVSWEEEATV